GRTIILITHRLADVLGHTDAVTILRRGRDVAHRRTADTTYDELAGMLVATGTGETSVAGLRAHAAATPVASPVDASSSHGPALLELRNVSLPASEHGAPLFDVSLTVRAGEIVALVGVDGSGPSEVIRIAAGRLSPASGEVVLPTARGWIPENRHEEAIVPAMTTAENLVLGRQNDARFGGKGWIDYARITTHAAQLLDRYDVRPAEPGRTVDTLSGGNQQKLVVARETSDGPPLLVAAHPARGLDILATRRVHDELRAARGRGAAVLLMSTELDEVRAVADRIVVFYAGRIVGELTAGRATDEALGRLMTGGQPTEPVA
ncbi:MAG TPA: ATP-binding cassette domain-containing protein, partial [Candidatus Eisenbacteria bacterium]